MADETPENPLATMFRTVSLTLQPQGGRVFAHHAKLGKLNHQTIELKCQWCDDSSAFGSSVVIGQDRHPIHSFFSDDDDDREDENANPKREEAGWRLSSIPIMLSIYEVDEAWLKESASKQRGDPLLGQFSYNERGDTSDGVVSDKWPSCSAWIGVGSDTFAMIRDRVLIFKKYDFVVGIDVLFPSEAVETEWTGRKIDWDGKSDLSINGAVVVWQKEDWRWDVRHRLFPATSRQDDYVAPREHAELLQATNRIEAAVGKLVTPMWLVAGAIVAFLFFRH